MKKELFERRDRGEVEEKVVFIRIWVVFCGNLVFEEVF